MLQFICLIASLAVTASAECTRPFLKTTTASLITAQTKGTYTSFTALSSNLTYTEQFTPSDIRTGILSKPLKIDSSISFHDPILCTTFTQMIVTDPSHPYVIGTRMEADGSKVTKIESLVTDQGDWLFNITGYAHFNALEKWDPIPEGQRDSYAVIKAAGDAYFNRFANANVTVPFGTPCARLEGGAYTGSSNMSSNSCGLGLPSTINVVNRRYVVDEEMGAVDIFLGFPGLDALSSEPAPDSHLFRVEKGKIRYIHTLSTCEGHPGCGSNATLPTVRRRRTKSALAQL